jgi:PEP-CTERM motif
LSRPIKFLLLIALALATVGAQASSVTVNGTVYTVTDAEAQNAVLPIPGDATVHNTFTVTATSSISFSESDNSILTFLNSGGAMNITGGDGPMDPTLVTFIVNNFTLPHNTAFSVAHDDGASFYINGTSFFSQPGPTAFVLSSFTYTGPTVTGGTLELVYGECCSPPGIFETNLPTGGNTPEPGTLVMFGSGVIGLAGLLRRKINL